MCEPPLEAIVGKQVLNVRRLAKQIVWELEADLALVVHLIIAGRLHWKPPGAKLQGKVGLAAFDLPDGTLILTEASSKKGATQSVLLRWTNG
jgi:formamidopyrimidine-DNA glycosylase